MPQFLQTSQLNNRHRITLARVVGKSKSKRVQGSLLRSMSLAPSWFPMTVGESLKPSVSEWRHVASMPFVSVLKAAFGMHRATTKVAAPFTEPIQNNRSIWHGSLISSTAPRLEAWFTWPRSNWPQRIGSKTPIRLRKLRWLAMVGLVCLRNWVGECRLALLGSSPQ